MKHKFFLIFFLPILLSAMFYYEPKDLKLSRLEVKNSKYDEALKIYEKLSKNYSQRGDFQYNWANIYMKNQKYKEAVDHYRLSLSSTKYNIKKDKIYYNMGVMFEKNKKATEAVAMYKAALLKNPHNLEAKHNLELLLRHSKKGKNNKKSKKNKQNNSKQAEKKKEQQKKEKKDNKEKEKQMIMKAIQNKKEKFLPMKNQKARVGNVEKDW